MKEEMSIEDYNRLIAEAREEEIIRIKGMKFEYQLIMPGQIESILALSHYASALMDISDSNKLSNAIKDGQSGDIDLEKIKINLNPEKAEALIEFSRELICKSSYKPKITKEGSENSLKYDGLPSYDKNKLFSELFRKIQEGMKGLDEIDFFRPNNIREAPGNVKCPATDTSNMADAGRDKGDST